MSGSGKRPEKRLRLVIRPAVEKDLPQLRKLDEEALKSPKRELFIPASVYQEAAMGSARYSLLVALLGRKIVGVRSLHHAKSESCEFGNVYVSPFYGFTSLRRRRIATALNIDALKCVFEERNYDRAHGHFYEEPTEAAKNAYKAVGFEVEGNYFSITREQYFSAKPRHAQIMRKWFK